MKAEILDGKLVASNVYKNLKNKVKILQQKNIQVGLAVVIVGNDPASHVYVNAKEKKAKELGFLSKKIVLEENTSQEEILNIIKELNNDDTIHGILVQSPVPKHIDEEQIILAINPSKDVDCFHPENVGKMIIGKNDISLPCTPQGCIEILKHYKIDTAKNIVVIGRSLIVGKPLANLLARREYNATVTLCHSATSNLEFYTKNADIIITAIGKANFLKKDMIKEGCVILDVGINRVIIDDKKRLIGDVDFNDVKDKASFVTPVPGGVGPMTIAILMQNTFNSCLKIKNMTIS